MEEGAARVDPARGAAGHPLVRLEVSVLFVADDRAPNPLLLVGCCWLLLLTTLMFRQRRCRWGTWDDGAAKDRAGLVLERDEARGHESILLV